MISLKQAIPLKDKIVTALAQVVDSSVAPVERTVCHVDAAKDNANPVATIDGSLELPRLRQQ